MKNVILGAFSLLLVAGCSGSGGPLLDGASRFQEMAQDIQIDGARGVSIEEALAHHGSDGATVVVFEEGVPTLLRGHYGYQDRASGIETDEATIYQAASLTKFVAGLAMVKEARLGSDFGLARKVRQTADDHPFSLVRVWADIQGVSGAGVLVATTEVSLRRLLKNAAGINRPTTGTECVTPSQTTGLDDLMDPASCTQC